MAKATTIWATKYRIICLLLNVLNEYPWINTDINKQTNGGEEKNILRKRSWNDYWRTFNKVPDQYFSSSQINKKYGKSDKLSQRRGV